MLTAVTLLVGAAVLRVAYSMAERSSGHGHFAVFWASYLLVVGAVAAYAWFRASNRLATLALLGGFGIYTYLPKLLMSLHGPVYYDEYGHYRHLQDILATHSVNVDSTYLPIVKYFPGLELVTAAVHEASRLTTWQAALIVIGAAHVVTLVAVWQLALALRLPDRWAVLAAIVFASNPNFTYFDTEFGYESLGLALALVSIVMFVRARQSRTAGRAWAWTAGTMLLSGATIFTHHASAAFMCGILLTLALAFPPLRQDRRQRATVIGPWVAALGATVGLTLWVDLVATGTYAYIAPHVHNGLVGVFDVLTGQKQVVSSGSGRVTVSPGHHLFAGAGVPIYEIVCAFITPVVALAVLAGALIGSWWERDWHDEIRRRLPFLLLGLLYPLSLPLALTISGGETAHRLWTYAYIGLAPCVYWAWPVYQKAMARLRVALAPSAALLLVLLLVAVVGNVASGEDVYYRFPGPYLFGTDTRSHTAETYQLADWLRRHLRPGQNVVTDRDTGEVITAYTRLDTPAPANTPVYQLYLQGNRPSPSLRRYLSEFGFSYWVLDLRIARDRPVQTLFATYAGPSSVNASAILQAGHGSSFLTVTHRTRDYEVLRISS
ncbi:MAG TPA: hypothetical protein VE990_07715 [Acidimicrobiales bacterium]|nr:hypothetical protein [Acidimicrobiales bacterium]